MHDTAGKTTDCGSDSPLARNMTDSSGMRSSNIVGSSVYDDQD
jgi:hypothetical protein